MNKINLGIILVIINLIILIWLTYRIESTNSSLISLSKQIEDIDDDIHGLHE